MRVTPEVFVYVNFIAEPFKPILWEVSSGRWHPPADEWLAGARARRIEALGFTIGGSQGNYQRRIVLEGAAAINAVVKTVLAIFYDVFEYRGTIPFEATLAWNVRAEEAMTFEAFTPEDVKKVFRMLGFTVARGVRQDRTPTRAACGAGRVA